RPIRGRMSAIRVASGLILLNLSSSHLDLKATLGLLSVRSHREPLNCSMKSKLAIEFNGLDVERPCGDLELRNTLLPGPCLRRFQQRPSHTGTACANTNYQIIYFHEPPSVADNVSRD